MSPQDELYESAVNEFGAALERLARACEANPDERLELVHEIHIALWRSFERYEGRCSLRTWVYRVAHNVAASHVARHVRSRTRTLVSLEDIDIADPADHERDLDERLTIERLIDLIRRLKPPDAQLMLLYLEDLDAATIGEVMGLSAGAVRVQIHRLKAILKRRFLGAEA